MLVMLLLKIIKQLALVRVIENSDPAYSNASRL